MKFNNEKGTTLVELLAVLLLVSMVATIILTTFFIANRHNAIETKKLRMQQEANYILTNVLEKHRTIKDCYKLNVIEEGNKVVFFDCDAPGNEVVIGENYKYGLTNVSNTVYPKKANFATTLTVRDPKNPNLFVSIDTTFKRYITD